jgi:repressor LexA
MFEVGILPDMGNKLKLLRKAKDWTHEQAAEAMGMSRSGFIKLERGERRLTLDYIGRAAKAFDVRPADVIDGDLDDDLNELLDLWAKMGEDERDQLLRNARIFAGRAPQA